MKSFALNRRVLTTVWVVLVCSLLTSSKLYAQVDTGLILGTVKDQTNAVVAGAVVILINEATNVTLKTTTNSLGGYQFSAMRVGTYTVSAVAGGFAQVSHQHLSLNIQQSLVIDFTL